MLIHFLIFYAVCVLGCLALVTLAHATKSLVVYKSHNAFCKTLEDAPFIYNIYRDEKKGINSGLADCILKSFIPGYNTFIFVGVNVSLLVVFCFVAMSKVYSKAAIKLTKFLDKALSKTFTKDRKDVLQ